MEFDYIRDICSADIINAKLTMACEITKLVHGQEEADNGLEAANSLFCNDSNFDKVPTRFVERDTVEQGIQLVDLLCPVELVPSGSEAIRLIKQHAISCNSQIVDDTYNTIN